MPLDPTERNVNPLLFQTGTEAHHRSASEYTNSFPDEGSGSQPLALLPQHTKATQRLAVANTALQYVTRYLRPAHTNRARGTTRNRPCCAVRSLPDPIYSARKQRKYPPHPHTPTFWKNQTPYFFRISLNFPLHLHPKVTAWPR